MEDEQSYTYGERLRDLIPFKSGLEDFGDAILEETQKEEAIEIQLEAETEKKEETNWLRNVELTANYEDIEYRETGLAVNFHNGGVHQLLDDVKDRIKTYLQESDSYEKVSFERNLA